MVREHPDNCIEIMTASPPPKLATTMEVADLKVQFYTLFTDVKPLGAREQGYFEGLLLDFAHEIDVIDELKSFHAWSLDKGSVNPRSKFREWLKRSRRYNRHSHQPT